MKSATFIDFEDSFSFNVVQELTLVGFSVEVINWKDFEINPINKTLLVLGPGPGQPEDYQSLFPLLKDWLKWEKPFFGICLGHQIFWHLQGKEVKRSEKPIHGQRVELFLDEDWKSWLGIYKRVFVQRYNSLAVPFGAAEGVPYLINFIQDQEILMTRSPHLITYQFHPESVGTTFRTEFMNVLHSII